MTLRERLGHWLWVVDHWIFGCPPKDITYAIDREVQRTQCEVCGRIHLERPV